jgi:hypothetical protein
LLSLIIRLIQNINFTVINKITSHILIFFSDKLNRNKIYDIFKKLNKINGQMRNLKNYENNNLNTDEVYIFNKRRF